MDFKLSVDVKPLTDRIASIQAGLMDRTVLHERIVITLQKRAFKQWPKEPKLSNFTLLSRRGDSVLQNTGYLRQSLIGTNPGEIARTQGTLNLAGKDVCVFGTSAIYARLQNFGPKGGILTPVRAKYLALPMTLQARKFRSPKDFKSPPLVLYPLKSKDGYYLVEGEFFTVSRGKNKGQKHLRPKWPSGKSKSRFPKAHYLLTKSVHIPARRFMPNETEVAEDVARVGNHWLATVYAGKRIDERPAA